MKIRALLLGAWFLLSAVTLPAHAAQQFLKPADAFNVTLAGVQHQAAVLHFHIAKGYYLYRDRIHISAAAPASLGRYQLPRGIVDSIPYYGKTVVFPKSFNLSVPVQTPTPPALLTVAFQGCAVNGICYPPRTVQLPVIAPAAHSPALPGHSILLELLAAFGAGLLLTFTPCVLPMVPILSSIIVGQGTARRSRTAGLSLAYVLGTATTYAGIGALAGATGAQLQAYFENAWGIGILSAIFVLLALSMFGLFELQMPAAFQSRLQDRSQQVRGGSLAGSYILGLLSALIVGACVSPLAISLLTVAISQHSPAL
ncbi:MAG TPA: protein-disulfide reductase DsbD domain-containing protein, partial [Acidiferrobacteraceae bacterium]|nr:protein-disulfide reductase DsbD domain-containing protein [Acidiferrobacteraceae bacterium]